MVRAVGMIDNSYGNLMNCLAYVTAGRKGPVGYAQKVKSINSFYRCRRKPVYK